MDVVATEDATDRDGGRVMLSEWTRLTLSMTAPRAPANQAWHGCAARERARAKQIKQARAQQTRTLRAPKPMSVRYLIVEDVAERLRCSTRTVHELTRTKRSHTAVCRVRAA